VLSEDDGDKVGADHADSDLPVRTRAALTIADAALERRSLTSEERAFVDEHLGAAEQSEAAVSVGVFVGFADSIIIALGLEPRSMPVIVVPPPLSDPPET
jgi:hypothetical protein